VLAGAPAAARARRAFARAWKAECVRVPLAESVCGRGRRCGRGSLEEGEKGIDFLLSEIREIEDTM